ncbi:MAG: hypothetical protein E7F14_03940 [Enterococcus faecalis]|nr:hypothetical protein [Enterococcus faecalis]
MDLENNVFSTSSYTLEEVKLMKLASEWFYEAGRLPSIKWAQVTHGDVAVSAIKDLLDKGSAPYHFGTVDNIFPVYIHAIKASVELYKSFCDHRPPYFSRTSNAEEIERTIETASNFGINLKKEYFTRFLALEEILLKLEADIDFFEDISNPWK